MPQCYYIKVGFKLVFIAQTCYRDVFIYSQILALEPVDRPGRTLLVANTHLYFHPTACHVRIIQNLIAMRYIENILNQYGRKVGTITVI